MKKFAAIALAVLLALLGFDFGHVRPAKAQSGTQHGIKLTWIAPSPIGGTGTLVGYNVYQATAQLGPYTKLTATPITATTYVVPSSSLTASTLYYFGFTTVDSGANESAILNIGDTAVVCASCDVSITSAATPPTNPNPPTGATAANI